MSELPGEPDSKYLKARDLGVFLEMWDVTRLVVFYKHGTTGRQRYREIEVDDLRSFLEESKGTA